MPHQGKPSSRGDLYVKVQAELPQDLTQQERELLKDLRDLHQSGVN
jgi:DnaJ-class molecular chaperone